jgi:hypothetical protein
MLFRVILFRHLEKFCFLPVENVKWILQISDIESSQSCSRTNSQDYLISVHMHCNISKWCSVLQGQAALFAGLSTHPQLRSHTPDQSLVTIRTWFLCDIITVAMQTIQVECDENGRDDKVLMLQVTVAVFSLDIIYVEDEGYVFYILKIMGPELGKH